MSFTSKLKQASKSNFETERALIVKVIPSDPKFDRFYMEDTEGNRTRLFIKPGEAVPEGASRVTCVGIIAKPQIGLDDKGNYQFAEEPVTAYVPRTGFTNWIENVQTQSYKGQIGAVAILEGTEATSEHAVGDMKVGDTYGIVTSVTYTDDNRCVAMANAVSNGAGLTF